MKNGPYQLVRAPESYPGTKYRGLYVYLHHLVWWLNTRVVPPKGSVVHHINGVKSDNTISNLQLLSADAHRKEHNELRRARCLLTIECGFCLKVFTLKRSKVNTRLKNSKYKKLFCSYYCGAKHQHSILVSKQHAGLLNRVV